MYGRLWAFNCDIGGAEIWGLIHEQIKRAEARYNELIRMIERSSIEPGAKKEKIEQIQVKKDKSAKLVAVGLR